MLRRILRKYGILTTAFGLTLIAIVLSVGITWGFNALLSGEPLGEGWIIAILAPAIITPILGTHTIRLLSQLDEAEQRLRILSNTDELTQTYNRRYFMQCAERELSQAKRFGETFSIAILDLDNFKDINDQYGHLAGDQVLRDLSQIFLLSTRQVDVFARFGGDEFIFLFPHTEAQQAQVCVKRIVESVESTRIAVGDSEIQLSFSMGVAVFESHMDNLDELLSLADGTLYQAKRSGGNRSCFYGTQNQPVQ